MKRYPGLPIGELHIKHNLQSSHFTLRANHFVASQIWHQFQLSEEWIEGSLQTDEWTDRYVHARMFVNLHIRFLARGS